MDFSTSPQTQPAPLSREAFTRIKFVLPQCLRAYPRTGIPHRADPERGMPLHQNPHGLNISQEAGDVQEQTEERVRGAGEELSERPRTAATCPLSSAHLLSEALAS